MQVIEQHPYVDQVVSPLADGEGVGASLADDPALLWLEDEVMKVGSLAHNEVDWPRVEREALQILADRSKDLKVLGFLMLSLQQNHDGERFALSLFLLHRVLDGWWQAAWPYPGERGQRARKMLFGQMLQRALKAVDNLSFDASVGDGRGFCLELLRQLTEQASGHGLPDDDLMALKRAVEKLPSVEQAPPSASASSPPSEPARETAPARPAATTATTGLAELTLDPGNERATRQSLLKVAELLTGTEPENPLGYRIRRYAIWYSITSLPPTRDGQRTDLAAVSADRVADYKEGLEKAPDQALWQRIEQSLSVSPFWLDGHWLSARVATALGREDCAEAIREALRAFVERLPALAELTFNDGSRFLSDEAADWLWATPAKAGLDGGAHPWDQAFGQACELLAQDQLAPALQLLEGGLAEAREPRDRFYWRLAHARLLKEAGLQSLASQQIHDLQQQVAGLTLDHWEPGLIRQLDRLAGTHS